MKNIDSQQWKRQVCGTSEWNFDRGWTISKHCNMTTARYFNKMGHHWCEAVTDSKASGARSFQYLKIYKTKERLESLRVPQGMELSLRNRGVGTALKGICLRGVTAWPSWERASVLVLSHYIITGQLMWKFEFSLSADCKPIVGTFEGFITSLNAILQFEQQKMPYFTPKNMSCNKNAWWQQLHERPPARPKFSCWRLPASLHQQLYKQPARQSLEGTPWGSPASATVRGSGRAGQGCHALVWLTGRV